MVRLGSCIKISSILYLVLIWRLVNGQSYDKESNGRNTEIEKEFRYNKGKEILKYMNLSANPCDDFYDFACGQWGNYHKEKNGYGLLTNQLVLEQLINKELQQILSRNGAQDSGNTRRVKDFYRSCLTAPKSTAEFHSFISNFVRKYGGLPSLQNTNWQPNNNWLQVIAKLRANYGMDILIGLDVDTKLNAMRGNQICLTEPKNTLLPPNLCSSLASETIDQHDEEYNNIQREIADNMQSWFSLNTAESNRLAGDIIRFEFELCKDMRKHHSIKAQNEKAQTKQSMIRVNRLRKEHKIDTPFLYDTLDRLTQHFRDVIDFKNFIYFTLNVTNNEMVYMRSEAYFERLAATLRANSKQTLATYIMYRGLSDFAIPNGDRSNYCVAQVLRYYPKQIGELYNQKMYRGEIKSDIELLSKDIFNSFTDQLETAIWLEHNDKNAVKQRFSQFELHLPSYQNLDLDDSPIKNTYWTRLESAMKYNAIKKLDLLYSGEHYTGANTLESTTPDIKFSNKYILLGWALLQNPYYNYRFPKALKYSLVGQRIARELAAAFSEQQWSDSIVTTTPWNENTLEGYRNRSECLRKQYSNYLHNDPEVFQNASKLQELILSNSGLNIAFNGYLRWLHETDYRSFLIRETLPELNFSNTQLFFINFAQMHCASKYENNPPPEYFPLDKHTPERYQVNGPLSNCPEFSREFGCAMGTEMNPDDKCVIY